MTRTFTASFKPITWIYDEVYERYHSRETEFVVCKRGDKWDFRYGEWPRFEEYRYDTAKDALDAAQEAHEKEILSKLHIHAFL